LPHSLLCQNTDVQVIYAGGMTDVQQGKYLRDALISIEAGKTADIIAVKGYPIKNIEVLE